MLIPSIDIQGGRAVQLRQGRDRILDGGDPLTLLERFGRLGEVAVVDLDADSALRVAFDTLLEQVAASNGAFWCTQLVTLK